MSPTPDEIETRVNEQAATVEERLEHIPDSYSMPDLEDMTLHTAKKFDLGIVFIDINDFTDYTDRNDYDEILFMLNMFIPEAMELVRDYDGYFEKNTGDGVMAYFGAGEDDEETAELVIEYLSALKYALANHINPSLSDHGIEPISISAGATMGKAYISRIGVHSLNRRTAISVAANVASKLENASSTNEFYVGEGIYEYTHESFDEDPFEKLGHFSPYVWENEETGERMPYQHYNFVGGWEGTNWENLEPAG
ncbi:adenylate/guanylate cyclase domain-containing protein [Halorientalis pallida]|uniref:adenylate/guanylate cyclase domain-containing protein n=1 Tax=Halorientalis pallida TaxID=2479928 RepID=UPI003C6EAD55